MPGFLPAARLRRLPPPLVPYPAPVRTMLTTHASHVNLLNTTVLATTLQSLDFWSAGVLTPNQIRSGAATNDQQNNYWISASYSRITTFSPGSPATITTATEHGLVDHDVVEIFGAALPAANGLHEVLETSPTQFTISGVDLGGMDDVASQGYVEKHADAVARRQGVVDGGSSNPAAAPLRVPADTTAGVFRGIGPTSATTTSATPAATSRSTWRSTCRARPSRLPTRS